MLTWCIYCLATSLCCLVTIRWGFFTCHASACDNTGLEADAPSASCVKLHRQSNSRLPGNPVPAELDRPLRPEAKTALSETLRRLHPVQWFRTRPSLSVLHPEALNPKPPIPCSHTSCACMLRTCSTAYEKPALCPHVALFSHTPVVTGRLPTARSYPTTTLHTAALDEYAVCASRTHVQQPLRTPSAIAAPMLAALPRSSLVFCSAEIHGHGLRLHVAASLLAAVAGRSRQLQRPSRKKTCNFTLIGNR